MLKFSDFTLLVEAETSLRGSLSGADSYKTISHVLRYVAPYLNKNQVQSVVKNLGSHVSDPKKVIDSHQQLDGVEEKEHTHYLAKKHNDMEPGTPIKVTGVRIEDNKVLAQTRDHGEIPLSRIGKPKELAKKRVAKKAWGLEDVLAANLGGKPAGSSKEFHDFAYPPQKSEEKSKKVKGVAKVVGGEEIKPEEVLARGEAKGHNGVMGNAKIFWENGKGWNISHASPELAEHMKLAHVNGEPILDYLNKNHPNGVIEKGFRAKAPTGMTRRYLDSINSNVLHIHDLKKDVGTTFTVGDELHGKTRLGHLSSENIDSLDGIIDIAKTQNGKTLGFHRPNEKNMRTFASLSQNDPNSHRSLTNVDHAEEFKRNIDNLRTPEKPRPVNKTSQTSSKISSKPTNPTPSGGFGQYRGDGPGVNPDAEHGGRKWFTPQEKSIMKGNM